MEEQLCKVVLLVNSVFMLCDPLWETVLGCRICRACSECLVVSSRLFILVSKFLRIRIYMKLNSQRIYRGKQHRLSDVVVFLAKKIS